jgi:hypothetical protein
MPLMLFVALLIKLDSAGPVLFRQARHGYNNEPINVLMFRTLLQRNDEHQFCQASRDDPQMYDGQIERLSRRHNVKPGITRWAQVNGLRGETDTLADAPPSRPLRRSFVSGSFYAEQPFFCVFESVTGRFWREAAVKVWNKIMAVNLTGPMRLTKAVALS